MPRNNTIVFERSETSPCAEGRDPKNLFDPLSIGEEELLSELIDALRTIRYGSIAITLHEGRIVEIQRTERIRKNSNKVASAASGRGCND